MSRDREVTCQILTEDGNGKIRAITIRRPIKEGESKTQACIALALQGVNLIKRIKQERGAK